jgi:hypothetical protein
VGNNTVEVFGWSSIPVKYGAMLQATGYGLQVYRLQVTGYRLQVTGYRLQFTGYSLRAIGYRL